MANPDRKDLRIDYAAKIAHQSDLAPRRAIVLGNRDGEVIGGTGGNARPATLSEIAQVLNGGIHAPIDARPLMPLLKSHGDYVRASRQSLSVPQPQTPFEADYRWAKAEREARKKAARALRSKGNKGRKSA